MPYTIHRFIRESINGTYNTLLEAVIAPGLYAIYGSLIKVIHGRSDALSNLDSPGVSHSSTAEVTSQKLKELFLHFVPPSFLCDKPTLLVGLLVL